MGKAKELAELGDKLTVSGSAVTVSGFNYDNIVDSAPGALDTLNELAAALGDDANFSTTVTNSIATKLPLAGGTMTGSLILDSSSDLTVGNVGYWGGTSYGKLTWSATNNRAIVRGESGKNLSLGANGTQDYVFIKTDGNVGIGTNNPNRQLVLYRNDSDQTQIQFQNQTTGTGSSDGFGVGLDTQEDGFLWNYEGGDIYFGRASDRFMTLKGSSGNVGIGTSDPTPTASNYDSASLHISQVGSSSVGAQIRFSTGATGHAAGDGTFMAQWADSNFYITNQEANADIRFNAGGNSDMVVFDGQNGSVGINYSDPASTGAKLAVMGIAGSNAVFVKGNAGSGTSWGMGINAGSTSADASFRVYDKDGSNSYLYVRGDGNVGIGTTNPESNLEVSNGSERYRIAFGTGEVYLMARNASAYIEAEYIAEQHEFRGYGNDSGNLAWKINSSGHLIPGANDARNIGESGTAVSNMYMAGGIHFTNGGHGKAHGVLPGSSNYLDAYERGTFTHTLIGHSNPSHVTPGTANTTLYGTSYYEKIGNLCYVTCDHDVSNYNNYVFYHFGNLPFTSYNNSNMYYDMSAGHLRGIQFRYGGTTRTTFTFNVTVPSNSTQIDLRTTDPSTPFSGYFYVVNVNGGKYIRASGVYATA